MQDFRPLDVLKRGQRSKVKDKNTGHDDEIDDDGTADAIVHDAVMTTDCNSFRVLFDKIASVNGSLPPGL